MTNDKRKFKCGTFNCKVSDGMRVVGKCLRNF
jgi:hypothetical protein